MKTTPLIFLLLMAVSNIGLAADDNKIGRLKNAVVKIYTTSSAPDYFTPWRLLNPKQGSGSGAVISDNRILTNAHVIADARYIQAQKNGSPRKFLARVEFVSHEADLAILSVADEDFFDGQIPLPIGELPEPLQEVSVYGYPFGGNSLSITRGILSRVEHQYYSHSGRYLLAGQIDAAINPGNSGGPVIVNNKIVGVVMQANVSTQSENQGYFVPPSVIKHVLEDSQDGILDGMSDLGFRTQEMESPAMKAAYQAPPDNGGVLITKIFADSPASGKLQPDDVLLAIENFDIADDSSIEVRRDLRTNYKYAIDQHHPGDEVELTISRDGERQTVSITAGHRLQSYNLVRAEEFDVLPEYYVYGGIVFVPLNMNLIKRWGRDWRNRAPTEFLFYRNTWSSPEKREIVVALKVLAADVNLGYHSWNNWVLDKVNGTPIRDFRHFATLVHNATGDHITFENDDGYRMVIDTRQARESEQQILSLYQIPSPWSAGLFDESTKN